MLINNRYQVLQMLGEGGFGHAYLAEDTQMPSRRKCVIKQLKPITTSDEVYQVVKDRFEREAAILERLGENHQQIPRLYAYFTEEQKFYLVQEWIEGQTLESMSVPQPEKAVLDIMLALLPVLDFVHAQGIIHRDLKPDNIILRADTQQPVLIDFGAVRETMGTVMNSRQNPTSSIVIGTPGFMSSEQAAGRPIPSSDLYSLGLTAIYLLTGQMPQSLPSDPQTGELIWQQAASHVTPELVNILDKAVRSHPRDRYSSAQQMLAALATLPGVSVAANAMPTVLPATVPPSASRLDTVAMSSAQDTLPLEAAVPNAVSNVASEATARQLANAETEVANAPSSSHASVNQTVSTANSVSQDRREVAQPWSKRLTPLTMGLAVLLIGGSAIAGGLVVSRMSTGKSLQPFASSSESTASETPTERSAGASISLSAGDRTVEVDGQISSISPPVERPTEESPIAEKPSEPAEPTAPSPPVTPAPVEVPIQRNVTLSDPGSERIALYNSPSFDSLSKNYGVNGDRVVAIAQADSSAGGRWYKVAFDSGVERWLPASVTRDSTPSTPSPPTPVTPTGPKYGELLGSAGDRINVRSAPSTSANSPHYGVPGDPVQILDAASGSDGRTWYRVAFQSGAEGWVRSDLIGF